MDTPAEPVDHDALTAAGPTELDAVIDTGPQLAYSEELEALDYPQPASRVRVGLIAGAIVATAALVVGAVLVIGHSRRADPTPVAATPTTTTTATPIAAPPPPSLPTITTVIVQASPSTVTQSAKPSKVPVGTPVAEDPLFLAEMQAQGWSITNPAIMTLRAHQMCGSLQQGQSRDLIVQRLLSEASPPPWQDREIFLANQFLSTAMRVYPSCP